MNELSHLLPDAFHLRDEALAARAAGDHAAAEDCQRRAFEHARTQAANVEGEGLAVRTEKLRAAACIALDYGDAGEARRWVKEAIRLDPSLLGSERWNTLNDVQAWPDDWLVATVRRDPPDEAALDVLVGRHWATLYGRCRLLTGDGHRAEDLAQDTWCRLLRNRQALRPGRNVCGYLLTIATNLWRDRQRLSRRAGGLGEQRLVPLDGGVRSEEAGGGSLLDMLPDLQSLEEQAQRRLMIDVDAALARLSPHFREVLVARYLAGESCADIGRRHGRTEQAVSGWVREAIRQLRLFLNESPCISYREAKL